MCVCFLCASTKLPDTCRHLPRQVLAPNMAVSVRALNDTLDRVLHSVTAEGAYGNVTEVLFVLTLLLCSLVPVW